LAKTACLFIKVTRYLTHGRYLGSVDVFIVVAKESIFRGYEA